MADIRIHHPHELGLERARKVARRWAADAEKKYDCTCTITEGPGGDTIDFKRTGVNGVMKVTADHFAVDCKLGILFGAFKGKIEEEVTRQLDTALAKEMAKMAAAKAAADAGTGT